jgi:hypothetical protein
VFNAFFGLRRFSFGVWPTYRGIVFVILSPSKDRKRRLVEVPGTAIKVSRKIMG